MSAKKKTTKRSESRYTSAPSKPAAEKAKEAPAKHVEVKPVAAEKVSATAAKAPVESASVRLIAALRDSDADIARDAATSLGALGDTAAVEPLIHALNNVDGYYHAVVRSAAASSLGRIGDVRAVEPLIAAINDSLAEPSAEAIRALAVIGDSRAVAPLIEVVRNSNGFFLPIARRAAVSALSRFGSDQRAAEELLAVSTNSWEDAVIRQAAVDAIASAGKPGQK